MNYDLAEEAEAAAEWAEKEKRMELVLAEAFHGIHHVPNIKKYEGLCWEVKIVSPLSTFDFDTLTLLVLSAHKYAVRVEITAYWRATLMLRLHPRKRGGSMFERHPDIHEAIERYDQYSKGWTP